MQSDAWIHEIPPGEAIYITMARYGFRVRHSPRPQSGISWAEFVAVEIRDEDNAMFGDGPFHGWYFF